MAIGSSKTFFVSGQPGVWRHRGNRGALAQFAVVLLALLLVSVFLFSLTSGATDTSAAAVFHALATGNHSAIDTVDRIVIFDIRLPRAVLCTLVGSSLAVSGALMQGLFRNPLADPGIVGVSAGASLGAVSMMVLGTGTLAPFVSLFGIYHVPLAAFLGGLATTTLLYRLSTRQGRTSVATMLLAGIALAAMANAFTGLLTFWATDQQLRDLTFWGLGSLAGATWNKVLMALPIILPVVILAPLLSTGLNAMALGEAAAQHLGINTQRFKRIAVLAVAGATGAAVAVSGGIAFVGIVVPHLLRLMIGPDHRFLLPASALLGACMLIAADIIARQIVAPAELPIGIVTAAIGSPFFIYILLRRRGLVDL